MTEKSGKKLKSKRAFTLSELLVALLIFALVAACVAAGVSSAAKSVRGSAELNALSELCDSLMERVRAELRYSATKDTGDQPVFTSGRYPAASQIVPDDAGHLVIRSMGGDKDLLTPEFYGKCTAEISYPFDFDMSRYDVELTLRNDGAVVGTRSFPVDILQSGIAPESVLSDEEKYFSNYWDISNIAKVAKGLSLYFPDAAKTAAVMQMNLLDNFGAGRVDYPKTPKIPITSPYYFEFSSANLAKRAGNIGLVSVNWDAYMREASGIDDKDLFKLIGSTYNAGENKKIFIYLDSDYDLLAYTYQWTIDSKVWDIVVFADESRPVYRIRGSNGSVDAEHRRRFVYCYSQWMKDVNASGYNSGQAVYSFEFDQTPLLK